MGIALDILATVAITTGTFVLNWGMRGARGYVYSAASDYVLALMSFDAGALLTQDVLKKIVTYEMFKDKFADIFWVLFFLSMALWIVVFLPLENKMVEAYDPKKREYARGSSKALRIAILGCSWGLVMILLSPHIFVFMFSGF